MSQIIRAMNTFHQQDSDNTTDINIDVAADELEIPVTHAYVGKTTGGDAEALTLADGKPGQILIIKLEVDGGGDGTLTPIPSVYHENSWDTIVFADQGDQAILWYANNWAGWVILSLIGEDGPPAMTA